ncbi:hypothetical protein C1I98_22505 [Spongiactinospora gelatinilytica]|uniref:RNA polymerase sigma factor 70 region 4 type 2 domain-containing protein n=1 Tax=Spongiactinospora gelatinilytica TaxID=2666298 RepID=A0A2W2FYS7_9ACTN|nr:hypothetical protein C1I98_22505 [Spongiactinospora gelatinilytica]
MVSRVCYDQLTSARSRRESYIGQWLPEPVVEELGPEDRATMDDSISLALLAVLERLTPAERTSFVLHDVFDVPFDEIADIVGRSTGAVRQLASRARVRVRVREYGLRRTPERSAHLKMVAAFAAAATSGDLPGLVAALDPDVVWTAAAGSPRRSPRSPVRRRSPGWSWGWWSAGTRACPQSSARWTARRAWWCWTRRGRWTPCWRSPWRRAASPGWTSCAIRRSCGTSVCDTAH